MINAVLAWLTTLAHLPGPRLLVNETDHNERETGPSVRAAPRTRGRHQSWQVNPATICRDWATEVGPMQTVCGRLVRSGMLNPIDTPVVQWK